MASIEHALFFLLSISLILLSWLGFLFLNNYLSRMKRGVPQAILGTIVCFSLIASLGMIFNLFSLSFAIGLLVTIAVFFARYLVKKSMVAMRTE